MNEKKISFIGDLLIIIVIVLALYFAINIIHINEVKKIEKINQKYNVSKENLIPKNKENYIHDLERINKTYAKPIIEYIYLDDNAKRINRMVNNNVLSGNDCVSSKLYLEVNYFTQVQENLLDKFENLYSKKLERIYWDKYISNLKENNDYKYLKTEITKLKICD